MTTASQKTLHVLEQIVKVVPGSIQGHDAVVYEPEDVGGDLWPVRLPYTNF